MVVGAVTTRALALTMLSASPSMVISQAHSVKVASSVAVIKEIVMCESGHEQKTPALLRS